VLGSDPPRSGLVLRPPQPGDLGWVVERRGARYAAEYGWDSTFDQAAGAAPSTRWISGFIACT
jgi:hypothetical protein